MLKLICVAIAAAVLISGTPERPTLIGEETTIEAPFEVKVAPRARWRDLMEWIFPGMGRALGLA